MEVWLLWHIPPSAEEDGDYMFIGVYSSREAGLAAIDRLADQPGFRDHPDVVTDVEQPGFMLGPCTVDHDNWAEGYARLSR